MDISRITWAVEIGAEVMGRTTVTNTAVVSDAYGLFQTYPALVVVPERYHHIYLPLVLSRWPELHLKGAAL